ncbi:DNA translocase FtsK, partial [Bacillus sp. WP8]|uniref:DNA translocase FtsK n=1 Tax=Bacillus sp. WP8 TaxID=756828 RepID=UPI0037C0DA96
MQHHPQPPLKLNKITNLSHHIKLTFSPNHIPIQPPIPPNNTIPIQLPNLHTKILFL